MPELHEDALNAMAQRFYEKMGPGMVATSMTAKPDIVAGLRGALEVLAERGLRIVKTVPNSPGESDPRLVIASAWLALGNIPSGNVEASAEMMLDELDNESPDVTIRRLQQTIGELHGGDAVEWNLGRATMIVSELTELAGVQSALKAAFKNDELDGGWKTALEHPLYLQAEARKASLQDELKGLI